MPLLFILQVGTDREKPRVQWGIYEAKRAVHVGQYACLTGSIAVRKQHTVVAIFKELYRNVPYRCAVLINYAALQDPQWRQCIPH